MNNRNVLLSPWNSVNILRARGEFVRAEGHHSPQTLRLSSEWLSQMKSMSSQWKVPGNNGDQHVLMLYQFRTMKEFTSLGEYRDSSDQQDGFHWQLWKLSDIWTSSLAMMCKKCWHTETLNTPFPLHAPEEGHVLLQDVAYSLFMINCLTEIREFLRCSWLSGKVLNSHLGSQWFKPALLLFSPVLLTVRANNTNVKQLCEVQWLSRLVLWWSNGIDIQGLELVCNVWVSLNYIICKTKCYIYK